MSGGRTGSGGRAAPARAELDSIVARVRPPAGSLSAATRAHLDRLTKPPGSLGRLEDVAVRLARITGAPPPRSERRVVFLLAGDHGVCGRGVSAYPSAVTTEMCRNLVGGGAAVCVLAREARCEVVVADLGVASEAVVPGAVDLRVRHGTDDLAARPAMSRTEALEAVQRGTSLVASETPAPDVVCLGEMGIGNSTSAAVLTTPLTGSDPTGAVGRGTGVSGPALEAKRAAVRAAVERVPADAEPLEILRQVGGLEVVGWFGVTLEAAARAVAVILDGFVASAAALVAVRIATPAAGFLFATHRSAEPGHSLLLRELGLRPLIDLGLRLGEGRGAVLALPLLDGAAAVLREMATFEGADVSGPLP